MKIANLIKGAICTLPDSDQELIDFDGLVNHWKDKIFSEENLLIEIENEQNKTIQSIWFKCIVAMRIFDAQESQSKINSHEIFMLINRSLNILDEVQILSRIGSQGFLSIPLFRLDLKEKSFDLLRLHIWDDSLESNINKEAAENFSIHSHQFHAHSWILSGNVSNTMFEVEDTNAETEFCHFEIGWKNNLKKVNERQSVARNTKKHVQVNEISHEDYHAGETYQIEAGLFHKSGIDKSQNINSTLFLFSSKRSRTKKSFVIGPSQIEESAINRSKAIDAKPLLKKLKDNI